MFVNEIIIIIVVEKDDEEIELIYLCISINIVLKSKVANKEIIERI